LTSTQSVLGPRSPFAGILYIGALVLFLDQLAILGASVYPAALDSVQWRFGSVGLAAGRATPFLICDLLFLSAGVLAGHRWFLRALGVLHVFVALVILAGVAGFILDTLEIRQMLPLETRQQAMASAIRAVVALVAVSIFCVVVGVRVIRGTPPASAARSADRRLVLDNRSEVAE